jgi:glycogen(starch) synthase
MSLPKIVLVGDYPPPAGGIAVHVQQLHRWLRERGVPVRVLDIGKGGHDRQDPGVLPARAPQTLVRRLARVSPDSVVHLHTSGNNPRAWYLTALVSLVLAHRAPPPVITVHSGKLPAFAARSPWNRLLIGTALARYGAVVAVSDAVAEALRRCRVPSEKLHVQPAFLASQVRLGRAPPALSDLRARCSPVISMADHPDPVYGRELIAAALPPLRARFPRLGLALFGPGSEATAAALKQPAIGLGELDSAAAQAVIAESDLFLRPTLADGDAISVREALALGVRCVASDASARPAGVTRFRSGEPASLLEAVDRALASPVPAAQAVDAGPALLAIYRQQATPLHLVSGPSRPEMMVSTR